MKKAIFTLFLSGFVVSIFAQGEISLVNIFNTSTDPTATANGLFWFSTGGTPVLINQDFNAAFYGGTDSSSLSPLATFLLSDGTAAHDNSFGPGTFADPAGRTFAFPSTTTVFIEIQAWTGNFNSLAAAMSGGALTAQSPVFVNPVDVPPGPAWPLTGMPAMVLSSIPEPSTFALFGLGGLCALLFRQPAQVVMLRTRSIMKIQILTGLLLAGLDATSYAQGQLQLLNIDNTSTSPVATANGLFWLSTGATPVLINQDFNAAFYAGTDSSSLAPLATFLLSNGTALGDNFGPGKFVDTIGNTYTFPSTTSVFLEIQAWTGNFSSYAAAVTGGAPAAQSPVFVNPVDLPLNPPADLTGMPAIVLSSIPEPSTFVLCGLGGICVLLFLQRKSRRRI